MIVQHNCGNTNAKAMRPFYDSLTQPQVIAVQEPAYNRMTKSTYCPKPYELAYEALPETRVCFMIRRDIGAAQWKRRQYGSNVAALKLTTLSGKITIVNVYNPRDGGPRLHEWDRIAEALQEAEGETLLLGDFNAHHQVWGGQGVVCEQNAEHLLIEAERRGLTLLTPQGEPTWKRGQQKSTIDLSFATYTLTGRVEYCGPEEKWAWRCNSSSRR